MSLKILATGKALPKTKVSNHELSQFLETNDEWIFSRTGIKTRHICKEESLLDLCVSAAKQALEKSNLAPDDIDYILCSTICGDDLMPSLACCISQQLGLSCPAFDMNSACSGFLYALDVADSHITAQKAKNILIVCGEMMSKLVDWQDRSTCVLFGDGAGAAVVGPGEALSYIHLGAQGNTKILNYRLGNGNSPFSLKKEHGYVHMQGQDVFKFAISTIEKESSAALLALDLLPSQIDYYLLHQANKRIIDLARTRLKQPEEKFPTNIERYGNISSASILILLDELLEEGKIKKGDTLFLCAFGAGLTTGAAVMTWE